ncbi:MAG: glycosyltransferase [Armatimonadota bacterium]
MRILEVLTHAEWGGRENMVVSLSQALARLGHDVTLACPDGTPMWRHAEAAGLDLLPFALPSKSFLLRDLWAMRRLLAPTRADVAHVHDRATYVSALHLLPGLRHPPMIYRVSGIRSLNSRRRFVFRHLPSPMVAVSRAVRDSLVADGVPPQHVVVIPNGLDVRAFQDEAGTREAARAEFGLDPDAPVVGGLGRLSPEKGFDDFLRAAQIVAQRHPQVQFLIVGDGPDRSSLERLAGQLGLTDRVVFTGYRADVPRALRCMDLLLFTATWEEAFGIVLIQAGALGLPIVATRSGASCEILVDGVTGLLVDKRAPAMAAAAVLELLDGAPRRREMGAAAAARVREHYDISLTARRWAELSEAVAAGRRPAWATSEAQPCP